MGTSAQLFCRMSYGYRIEKLPSSSLIEIPFFNQQRLLVAASLNGGNSIELLAKASNFSSAFISIYYIFIPIYRDLYRDLGFSSTKIVKSSLEQTSSL